MARNFRFERLEELPKALADSGFQVLSRRSETGRNYFDCSSAGDVRVSFWVAPPSSTGPSLFGWDTGKNIVESANIQIAAAKLVMLLEVRGFLIKDGDGPNN